MGEEYDSSSSADASDVEAAAAHAKGDLATNSILHDCRQLRASYVCLPELHARSKKESKRGLGRRIRISACPASIVCLAYCVDLHGRFPNLFQSIASNSIAQRCAGMAGDLMSSAAELHAPPSIAQPPSMRGK